MTGGARYPRERLVPPSAAGPGAFVKHARRLRRALGDDWLVEHVGSTSVPGLVAKPVIDLALRVPAAGDLADAGVRLSRAGWSEPEAVGDHWATYLLVAGVRTAIGHLFTAEQWETAHVRLFADWLRSHPQDRERYADLKRALVADGTWGHDYTAAKEGFVRKVVDRARTARGLPPTDGTL